MKSPRAMIAEDESMMREELAEQLQRLWPELDVVAIAADGIEALREFEAHRPDIVFLDINIPGLSGLEVARQLAGRCHVAFVTAFDSHAVKAFEEGAVDYVMKPLTAGRLITTVTRLKERLSAPPRDVSGAIQHLAVRGDASTYLRWINVARGNAVRLVTVDEVLYFKSDSKYTLVVTREGESVIRKTIKELCDELDPSMFWQIHRSSLVNVNAIDSVVRDIGGRVLLRLKQRNETLPVSETYAHLFRQM
jgi:DNA-binding LytR/AlgR family response regulator